MTTRRLALKSALAVAASASSPGWLLAQTAYPTRPIKIILPYAAGGVTDVAVRLIGEYMTEALKQPIVIDNKPGANGLIAYKAAETSPPDGYTLTMLTSSTASSFAVTRRANDINEKFRHIGNFYESTNVLIVAAKSPIHSIKDLVASAKANPGLGYASIGIGSTGHLTLAALSKREGLKMSHVPYRGGVLAVTDVSTGTVPVMYSDLGSASAFLKAGTVRPIAVSSEVRRASLPNVPTAAEQGYPDLTVMSFGGLSAPAATPDDRAALLTSVFEEALKQQKLIDRLNGMNLDTVYYAPARMKKAMADAYTTWLKVAEDNGIVVE